MAAKPAIAIVGPGRLGNAVAVALNRAGYKITEVVSRDNLQSRRKAKALAGKVGASPSTLKNADLSADLIWFCVPDREIMHAADSLSRSARWNGKTAVHSSGALSSDELNGLRKRGAEVASVHPFMTFVTKAVPPLKGVPFALEGDAAAVRIARRIICDLGGESLTLRKQDKAAYHAWGAFASPLLVSLLVNGEQVARIAGIPSRDARRKMLPILRQTLVNYAEFGPAGAFSGPLIRGDAEIVRKHLRVLKKTPEAREVYLALAKSALRHLPVRNRKKLEAELLSAPKAPLGAVEIGDRIRLITLPPDLRKARPETRDVFQRCIGREFPVVGFNKGLIELEVGDVMGASGVSHSIWVEPECLERAEMPDHKEAKHSKARMNRA